MAAIEATQVWVTGGAAAAGLAAILWALRVTRGERRASSDWQTRARRVETALSSSEAVFSSYPGVVIVWEPDAAADPAGGWGDPKLYGSPLALSSFFQFGDASDRQSPAARILDGLADLEARKIGGEDSTLRHELGPLRQAGMPFSLLILGRGGRFIEADGRVAGGAVVLWLMDSGIKGLEESNLRGAMEEAKIVISRDPAAFLDMMQRAHFPAWRLSSGLRLEWANKAYLDAVEARGLDVALARQSMIDPGVLDQADEALKTRNVVERLRWMTIAGKRRAMRTVLFPVSGGAAGMAFDVTAEEQARDELERHIKAHDETLNYLADGVAIFGPNRELMYFNDAFTRMWGLSPAFLKEKPQHSAILDKLRDLGKLPILRDYVLWRADQLSVYQVLSDMTPELWHLPSPDDRMIEVVRQRHPLGGVLLVFRDVTSEEDLKARYDAQLKVQRATLDELREGVAVFGSDARLKLFNRALAAIWRLDDQDLDARMDFDQFEEKCRPLFHDEPFWRGLRARITDPSPDARLPFRSEIRRSDEAILSIASRPLPDGATLLAFADITSQRSVQNLLTEKAEIYAQADRLKTEFGSNVTYQLRTPLFTIAGFTEMMLDEETEQGLSPEHREQLSAIKTASDQLSKMIDNIIDITMIEAGRFELDLDHVDLRELLNDARDMVVGMALDREISIVLRCPDDIGEIVADGRRLKQVLFNLLHNALRFTPPKGEVVLGAARLEDVIRLWVSDTGIGMDYENQARAFDSFVSTDQKGPGLGLSLVRSLVKLHAGWVAIRSDPGKGTTVTCNLPANLARNIPTGTDADAA